MGEERRPEEMPSMERHAEIEKTPWDTVDARAVVGRDYSSAQGAQRVNQALRQAGILPELPQGGGSCGA